MGRVRLMQTAVKGASRFNNNNNNNMFIVLNQKEFKRLLKYPRE